VPEESTLLFTANTSAAINLFCRLLGFTREDVIITSTIEHTSNYLPWKYNSEATIVSVNAHSDGSLDYDDLEKKVTDHATNLKLIALTGASNLTGHIPDIERIAALAHRHEALLFVDAAQLAPHRPILMKTQGIDVLAFSAHKIYAPFGLGVLALPKKIVATYPVDPGGGSIDMLSENTIIWAPPDVRHQTGTWNVTGIIAAAASCKTIRETGWEPIMEHERELVHYAARELEKIPGLTLYVPAAKYLSENRIGTFAFNLDGYHHALLSAMLENEYGIETRAGTICNHRLVRRWLNIDDRTQEEIEKNIVSGDRLASYGIVRASLAIHNTKEDIDALVSALMSIATNGPALTYTPVPTEDIYVCEE
jgi:cysteine desulfurase / selenocysteine lyase